MRSEGIGFVVFIEVEGVSKTKLVSRLCLTGGFSHLVERG